MFSLTLQMVQNIVEAASHQTELLGWGQELWSASCNTQGDSFCSGRVRNHCRNLSVQSCVLGDAVKVIVLGASVGAGAAGAAPGLLCRKVSSHVSLPWLTFTAGSLQLLKLNYRSDTQTGLFFWRPLQVPQAWGAHSEIHTKGFQGSFNGNQIFFFPRKVLHLVAVFILLKSKLNFQPS